VIKYLENENLEDLIKDGIYIVDFYADWCGPCKMMGSVLEKMTDINVIKVNTDNNQDLAIKFGVMSIPTLVFYKDGIEIKKEVGFKDEATLREIIKNL
jgi:thioredoxin 1